MEFKGTKGTWSTKDKLIYRRDWRELYEYGGGLAGDKPVASVMGTGFYDKEEIEANAKLIAAAPDLLYALQLLTHLHSCEQEGLSSGQPTPKDWYDAVNKANEAIEKALK